MKSIDIDKEKAVAFTGHRYQRIAIASADLRLKLHVTLEELINNGYTTFLSGMAEGFDMEAAEAVLKLKPRYPFVKLIAVVPFRGQEARFHESNKARYHRILDAADQTVELSDRYFTGCFHRRNDYLADNCSTMVCYFDGEPHGGTFYTVRRTENQRKEIINLAG